ncbi:MAG: sel1 repeat family protein [Micavibrio sp.]|nr:MAG: sel1 repeat family protein [Micavibrio sp.]
MTENDTDDLFNKACEEWDAGNTKQAFKLFSMAAGRGDSSSLNNLGYFYDHGIGISKNTNKAFQLYKKAARSGSVAAYNNIGIIYKDKNNFERARFWFLKALNVGDGEAALDLAKLYLKRNTKGDMASAERYLRLAIDSKCISEESVEEAEVLLEKFNAGKCEEGK